MAQATVQTIKPYTEEELQAVNALALLIVDAYNKHGGPYRDARQTYRSHLNQPAPSRFSGSTRRYGMDYRPETTAAINRYYDNLRRLRTEAEEAGYRVEELVMKAVTSTEGVELESFVNLSKAIAQFAPQGTSRKYRLDLDKPDSYELIYFTEEPVFWRLGKKNVRHELRIPVSLA